MRLNETYSKVLIDEYLTYFLVKQGDVIQPFIFNFTLDYAIRKVRGNQYLVYADDVNILGECVNNMKESTDAL